MSADGGRRSSLEKASADLLAQLAAASGRGREEARLFTIAAHAIEAWMLLARAYETDLDAIAVSLDALLENVDRSSTRAWAERQRALAEPMAAVLGRSGIDLTRPGLARVLMAASDRLSNEPETSDDCRLEG